MQSAGRGTTLRRGLEAALIAAAVAAGFANSLRNDFVFDDRRVIVENTRVTRQEWKAIWTRPGSWFPEADDTGWRPLTTTSFALNWKLFGRDPAAFRAFNLAVHAANSLLVAELGALIGLAAPAPLLAGLLFALHPVHAEVLNTVVGRADLLAALFLLLACRFYWLGRVRWALIFFGTGLLSKESSLPFIALIPLLAWLKSGRGADWRRVARDTGLAIAVVAACACYRQTMIGAVIASPAVEPAVNHVPGMQNPLGGATPVAARVANALYVLWRYLLLLVAPRHLSADYSLNAIPVLGVFAWRNVLAALLLAAAALGLGLWARGRRAVAFAAGFFVLTFVPVSNIPLAIGSIMAERFVYLPSAGFCLLAAMALAAAARPGALGAVLVLGLFAGRDVLRNRDWKDDNVLFLKTLETSPNSVFAMVNASHALLQRKDFAGARDLLLRALRETPTTDRYPLPYNNLGLAYMGLGDLGAAEASFQDALRRDPEDIDSWVNIGIVFAKQRRYDGAIAAFERALARAPDAAKLHYNLALACKQKAEVLAAWGDAPQARAARVRAREHFRRALALFPAYGEAAGALADLEARFPK
ncbi:MAG: tetratricopeptide repeat protein [Elusimicrobia bacterium]|nr:tetratricopeptide repeat protein [Elusimicrobiota bacterium]